MPVNKINKITTSKWYQRLTIFFSSNLTVESIMIISNIKIIKNRKYCRIYFPRLVLKPCNS